MSNSPLFRYAAVKSYQTKWVGEIVLARPLSVAVMTGICTLLGVLVSVFVFTASYTRRITVSGQLVPNSGVIKIYSPQPAIIVGKKVREGVHFKKGEILYVISSERQSGMLIGVQESISRQVSLREQSLRQEILQLQATKAIDESSIRKKLRSLTSEISNLSSQILGQRLRLELSEQATKRAHDLQAAGYISSEMEQVKRADLLDQRARYDNLEREKLGVEREIEAAQNELKTLPFRYQSQVAQIERQLASAEQELTESESKRRIAITAPESGVATAATAEIGQATDGTVPLVSIIPQGSKLQAELFAPSQAVGFVRRGDTVLLRYQSFPYQKYGHARGTVLSISKTVLSGSELIGASAAVRSGEPVYRITVALEAQAIAAYGQRRPLQAGMWLEADIMRERRRLYEWILEPLYTITGKL
jgi:membrane fusion protein